jgi:hypothetical protein
VFAGHSRAGDLPRHLNYEHSVASFAILGTLITSCQASNIHVMADIGFHSGLFLCLDVLLASGPVRDRFGVVVGSLDGLNGWMDLKGVNDIQKFHAMRSWMSTAGPALGRALQAACYRLQVRHETQDHVVVQTCWCCVVVPAAMDSSKAAFTVVVAVAAGCNDAVQHPVLSFGHPHGTQPQFIDVSGHMVMLARRCEAASASWRDGSCLACPRTPLPRRAACR